MADVAASATFVSITTGRPRLHREDPYLQFSQATEKADQESDCN